LASQMDEGYNFSDSSTSAPAENVSYNNDGFGSTLSQTTRLLDNTNSLGQTEESNPTSETLNNTEGYINSATDFDDLFTGVRNIEKGELTKQGKTVMPHGVNDWLTLASAGLGLGKGINEIENGNTRKGIFQTAKSTASAVDGGAGIFGHTKTSNVASGVGNTISAVDNIITATTSQNQEEATEAAQGALQDGFFAASDFAGGNKTPWGLALKAGGWGAKGGKLLIDLANPYGKEQGLHGKDESGQYHNLGENLTGSEAAGDTGRLIENYMRKSKYQPDFLAGTSGGLASMTMGILNAGYDGGHWVGSSVKGLVTGGSSVDEKPLNETTEQFNADEDKREEEETLKRLNQGVGFGTTTVKDSFGGR
jgi:hypothetical protein